MDPFRVLLASTLSGHTIAPEDPAAVEWVVLWVITAKFGGVLSPAVGRVEEMVNATELTMAVCADIDIHTKMALLGFMRRMPALRKVCCKGPYADRMAGFFPAVETVDLRVRALSDGMHAASRHREGPTRFWIEVRGGADAIVDVPAPPPGARHAGGPP